MGPSIFKAYDVRRTYPDQMDEELAYRIGRGFARVLSDLHDVPLPELRVAVGRVGIGEFKELSLTASRGRRRTRPMRSQPRMSAKPSAKPPSGHRSGRDPADARGDRRRERHGRADGRPPARLLPDRASKALLEPDGEFPDHEPNPL
jgi:hypothetical protein